jgi:hypothetical protein
MKKPSGHEPEGMCKELREKLLSYHNDRFLHDHEATTMIAHRISVKPTDHKKTHRDFRSPSLPFGKVNRVERRE